MNINEAGAKALNASAFRSQEGAVDQPLLRDPNSHWFVNEEFQASALRQRELHPAIGEMARLRKIKFNSSICSPSPRIELGVGQLDHVGGLSASTIGDCILAPPSRSGSLTFVILNFCSPAFLLKLTDGSLIKRSTDASRFATRPRLPFGHGAMSKQCLKRRHSGPGDHVSEGRSIRKGPQRMGEDAQLAHHDGERSH